jgi:hypothetical protein
MKTDGWKTGEADWHRGRGGLKPDPEGPSQPPGDRLVRRPRALKRYFTDHRAAMMALIVDCPFEPNPTDCPVYDLRKLDLVERVAWVRGLTDTDCREFYLQHLKCLAVKESPLSEPVAAS